MTMDVTFRDGETHQIISNDTTKEFTVTHTFPHPGVYQVEVKVHNALVGPDPFIQKIKVQHSIDHISAKVKVPVRLPDGIAEIYILQPDDGAKFMDLQIKVNFGDENKELHQAEFEYSLSFPHDLAVGFSLNEFRGTWKITFMK